MSLFNKKSSRARALLSVQQESFAVDEARLYLDTHPNDEKAKQYFDKHLDARLKAIDEFERNYGPLLTDNISASKCGWHWIDNPMPWDESED